MKMPDETMPNMVLVAENDNDDFQLTPRERRLISNFRATKWSAQEMLVDLSEQYMRTLPAVPVKLALVRAPSKL